MFKFFRRIRQNLLSEGKTATYFKYAIGEIILVVIGIVIALQIDNFNNGIQQRKIEQAYLLSLRSEFKTNLDKLNNSIASNQNYIQAVEHMLTFFDTDVRDTISEGAISEAIYSVFSGSPIYKPSMGVVTDIISSGNLNVIQNETLRQKIASFESNLDFLKSQESAIGERHDIMQTHLNKTGSVRKVLLYKGMKLEHQSISDKLSNTEIFNSIEFENMLLDY